MQQSYCAKPAVRHARYQSTGLRRQPSNENRLPETLEPIWPKVNQDRCDCNYMQPTIKADRASLHSGSTNVPHLERCSTLFSLFSSVSTDYAWGMIGLGQPRTTWRAGILRSGSIPRWQHLRVASGDEVQVHVGMLTNR